MQGFLIVGKSELYRGVDRSPWSMLADIYYSSADRKWKGWYKDKILNNFSEGLGIPLVSERVSMNAARILIEENISDFEVVFVCSPDDVFSVDINAMYLGVDIYFSGYGSPVFEGIIRAPEKFNGCPVELNSYGLLNNKEECEEYMKYYNCLYEREGLEDFVSGDPDRVLVAIFSVCDGKNIYFG